MSIFQSLYVAIIKVVNTCCTVELNGQISSGVAAIKEAGSSTSLPSIALFGETCVVLCSVILYADKIEGIFEGHSWGFWLVVARSICKIVLSALSVKPSDRGWNGVVRVFLTPAISHSSFARDDSKFLPWSECYCLGRPNLAKKNAKESGHACVCFLVG